ncbi:G-protein alpha subunit-domain-containing protein [Mycena olivaceomarginata]|nr:G-protein alpha subunit-domain-containing protein [Mycena olivaceomarginata]
MGGCISSPAPPGAEVSDRDRQLHRQAEKALKDAKAKMAVQVKVLLLGSGDSGKSTILKQMRLIHRVPFSPQETESFRQLVFDNLTRRLKYLLDALPDMELELPPAYADVDDAGLVRGWAPGEGAATLAALAGKRSKKGGGNGDNGEDDEGVRGVRGEGIADDVVLIENAEDLRDGEPFPLRFLWGAWRSVCLSFFRRSFVALSVTSHFTYITPHVLVPASCYPHLLCLASIPFLPSTLLFSPLPSPLFTSLVLSLAPTRADPLPQPLARLWAEPVVRTAWSRGNEAAVPEKCVPSFSLVLSSSFVPLPPLLCHVGVGSNPHRRA